MTAPSGGTTTDAARYKVGDIVNVRGHIDRDYDGTLFVSIPREPSAPGGPGSLHRPNLSLLPAENVELVPDPPAPYTEPREGDRVLIEREPVEGVVAFIGDEPYCHGGDRTAYVDCVSFAAAAAEGRVRLVKAAAPTYEAGRIYRSESEDEWYLYSPDGALALTTSHWVRLSTADWVQDTSVPSDLVPCDVVPREAT